MSLGRSRWHVLDIRRPPMRCFLDLRQELDSGHQTEGDLDPVTG
ncbi:hypothetical protein OG828_48755 [Streptomyces sp. NBC_00457]|jgi:hypothetical protein